MNKKPIRWGIIGCGKIAHKFAQDLQSIHDAILQAVASRSLYKAKEFGNQYNALSCYGNYKEIASDPEVDVLYIATPHVFHYENTLMCLRYGKAILCEKPFAMDRDQVLSMIDKATSQKVFLMEALWTYFLPHYQFVLQIIHSKTLGEVKSLKADFGFIGNPDPEGRIYNKELGGGSLMDVGIYPLFVALTILGIPEKVEAKASFSDTGVDESCTMKLTYQNGAVADLFSSINQKTNTQAMIELKNGSILIHGSFHQPTHITIKNDQKEEIIRFPVTTNGYNFEAIHVIEMLRAGRTESTIMTFERSLQLISLLDKVRAEIGLEYMN